MNIQLFPPAVIFLKMAKNLRDCIHISKNKLKAWHLFTIVDFFLRLSISSYLVKPQTLSKQYFYKEKNAQCSYYLYFSYKREYFPSYRNNWKWRIALIVRGGGGDKIDSFRNKILYLDVICNRKFKLQ